MPRRRCVSAQLPAETSPRSLGGLGLPIIDNLADAWGIDPATDGKIVWRSSTVTRSISRCVRSSSPADEEATTRRSPAYRCWGIGRGVLAAWLHFCRPCARARNFQYHFPLTKPPKAANPTIPTITPRNTLQNNAMMIPAITSAPPKPMPAKPRSLVLVAIVVLQTLCARCARQRLLPRAKTNESWHHGFNPGCAGTT